MNRAKLGITMILAVTLMVIGAGFAPAQEDPEGDPVVVVVGDTEIKESDILNEIQVLLKQVSRQMQGRIPPDFQKKANTRFFSDALNREISTTLLEIKAEKDNVKVDEEKIDAQIEQVKQQLPENMTLEQALTMQQMTVDDLREQMRKNLLYETVIKQNVDEPDQPTEEEMKTFYQENKQLFPTDPQVRASHILFQFPQDGEVSDEKKAEMKKELKDLRGKIVNDEISFSEAAKKYSDGPSKTRGGDLNYFTKERMVPEFSKVAFDSEVGEISDIVETQFGYHLIKVTDKRQPDFESSKEQIRERLGAQKYQKSVQDFIESLKKDIKVERKMTDKEWMARHQVEEPDKMDQPRIQIDPEQLKGMN